MQADLARLVERVMLSPLWESLYGRRNEPTSQQVLQDLIKVCVAANTFDKLPDATQKFLTDCTRVFIGNKDRNPDVDFLPDSEIRPIGTIGNQILLLVGIEQGSDALVVARANSTDNYFLEKLFAIPLYELLSHVQDPVSIDKTAIPSQSRL